MSLSPQFLDALRDRTTLSALVGATLKLEKAGREYKACCPFHGEKTPSFTINDEKGFYHCFGCGAHGDAIRWLVDQGGLPFMDAVRQLAADAGMEVPAASPEVARREAAIADVHDVLATAGVWYAQQLRDAPAAMEMLIERSVSVAAIARFGLGLAPSRRSVSACGAGVAALETAGLLVEADNGLRDRFRARIMIPIHDARGRAVGFGARATHDSQSQKYLNSPDADHFDKGAILYNLHRAAPAAKAAKRLVIVEGYFDVIGLDSVGIGEAVAPMGTALTEQQLQRAWRVVHAPILLFDGDAPGRAAAAKSAARALPGVGPGGSLAIGILPDGSDPDDLARSGGRDAVEAVLAAAVPLVDFLWTAALAEAPLVTPEGKATLWKRLAFLAATIRDPETAAHYLTDWRARFDAAFPPPPPGVAEEEMLPDGSVEASLSQQGAGVRTLLRRVARAWLERQRGMVDASAAAVGRFAWDAGRRVGAGLIDESEYRSALDDLYPRSDAEPADVERSFAAGQKRGGVVDSMLLDMRCAAFQRTDMGNAERWNARYGRDYLYTTAKGWLGWDGRRYRVLVQEKDSTPAEVMASVFETVRAIQREAGFVRDTGVDEPPEPFEEKMPVRLTAHWECHAETGSHPDGLDTLLDIKSGKISLLSDLIGRWGRASEASGRLGCIANLAKRWVTVELTDFDTNEMLLNCRNGTLHFLHAGDGLPARVELRPHDRADRLTKLTACDYDPDAPAPLYDGLIRWAQPNPAMRRYLRQWAGYCLTGDMREQIFHIWYGPLAANGKSTVSNAWREAAGDYGATTNVQTFLDEGVKKRGDQATPDLVRLPGVRLLTAGEPPKGAKIDEALINSVTGGDPMLVRDNFRSFFEFKPSFKFTLSCNDLPAIPQGTAGIWRRVKIVPWEQHRKVEDRDGDLPRKLAAELAGILAWMVRGAIDWMEHGFVEPDSVTVATVDFKEDSDPLSAFLRLCTVVDPESRVQSSHLYDLFCAWCKVAGETEWKQKGFSQAMKAKGFSKKTSNGVQWEGLRMTHAVGDFIDHEGKVKTIVEDRAPMPPSDDVDRPAPPPPDDIGDDFVPGF
ncbi:hypothetical protein BH10PSE12_BH10PSE12_02860 [soil metagenome]